MGMQVGASAERNMVCGRRSGLAILCLSLCAASLPKGAANDETIEIGVFDYTDNMTWTFKQGIDEPLNDMLTTLFEAEPGLSNETALFFGGNAIEDGVTARHLGLGNQAVLTFGPPNGHYDIDSSRGCSGDDSTYTGQMFLHIDVPLAENNAAFGEHCLYVTQTKYAAPYLAPVLPPGDLAPLLQAELKDAFAPATDTDSVRLLSIRCWEVPSGMPSPVPSDQLARVEVVVQIALDDGLLMDSPGTHAVIDEVTDIINDGESLVLVQMMVAREAQGT